MKRPQSLSEIDPEPSRASISCDGPSPQEEELEEELVVFGAALTILNGIFVGETVDT
jgi:hypothetical protein